MPGHHHHHHEISGKGLGYSILLNIAITIAEVVGGIISGSMSLLTDAAHNFSDVLSLIISYVANRLSKRKATEKFTYGLKRSEILAAFINSTTLIVIAIIILVESAERIYDPKPIAAEWVIYLALASIAVNGLSVLFIKKDIAGSMNIKSAYLHLFTDMLTSIAVLMGGLAMKYFQWYGLDAVLSIIIAFYLIYMSWDIFKSSLKILMQFTPPGIDIDKICNHMQQITGIENMHHVHAWQLNENDIIFEAHIDLSENVRISEFEKILTEIKKVLEDSGIRHCNIQPEFSVNDSKQRIH